MKKVMLVAVIAILGFANVKCTNEPIENEVEIQSPDGGEVEDPDDRGNG